MSCPAILGFQLRTWQQLGLRLLAALLTLLGLPVALLAQTGATGLTDWTETEVTPEMLVEALRPAVEPPPRSRSLDRGDCSRFHRQQSRGIRPVAVSEDVAITVQFASDSAELTAEARSALDQLGAALQDPALAECCFRVEGHTDSQNSEEYNQELSEARARSAVEYLVNHFDLDPDRLLLEGWGETRPISDNDDPEGRQKNRRVQVSNLGYRSSEGGS